TWRGNFVPRQNIPKPHRHAEHAHPFPAIDDDAHIHGAPPVERNDIEQRAEVTITWDLAVQRGEQLICQMMNTKERATKELIEKGKLQEGGSSQSRWTDPNEMADYGWVVSTDTPDADDTIQEGLQWVGAKRTYTRDSLVMATHESQWTDIDGSRMKIFSAAAWLAWNNC
ncbi:hypothetical protein LTS18_009303, partial [Coniosporium uncinatum]